MSVLSSERPSRLPRGWRLSMRQFLLYQVGLPALGLAVLFGAFARFLPVHPETGAFYYKAAIALALFSALIAAGAFALTYFAPQRRNNVHHY